MKQLMDNKSGLSYIYLCVLILFLSMLTSVLFLYMELTARVEVQKRDVQRKVDGYIAEYAVESFDALKQGNSYEKYMDYTDLVSRAYVALGFEDESDTEYAYPNGISMSRPVITALEGDGFGLKVEYTSYFPIQWNGSEFTSLAIPVTVTGYYKAK